MTKLVKRLYKNDTDKVIAGVCSGIADYFDLDPVLVRVVYLFATIVTGIVPGAIAYLIAMLIIPARPLTPPSKVILPDEIL